MTTDSSPRARRGVRRALTSFASAAAAATLAFGLSAAPAAAEPEAPSNSTQAQYTDNILKGLNLEFEGHDPSRAYLFKLKIGEDAWVPAYCIDLDTRILDKAYYQEGEWSEYPGEGVFADSQPGKVLWILQNSYPEVDSATLGEEAGIDGLTDEQAMSATQAAIWHFSNGAKLSKDNNANVLALYGYLLEKAEEVQQAPASLTITPDEASGEAGNPIGEFTVATNADSVSLELTTETEGVQILDIEAHEINEIHDGQIFTVHVPEDAPDGEATVTGTAQTVVQLGRLFKGVEDQEETQTLITAGAGETEATAEVTITWTAKKPGESPSPTPSVTESPSLPPEESPSPNPSETESPSPKPTPPADDKPGLPVTGAALGGLIAAAVVAVGGGGAAMFLARKRRSGADDV
ncbi:thioester domain-containing protein [Thermobifida halotolerans]|uniref:thioester domain-containing protein n=1 Tax=Thermobifida halotolerans TaxID=483545 RepID=UPI000838D156|nr:thioester domain-containing protein [Thermobifida halotolerans]